MKITATFDVDETIILTEASKATGNTMDLSDAITQEFGWLQDSGMSLVEWHFREQEKEQPAEKEGSSISRTPMTEDSRHDDPTVFYVDTDHGLEELYKGFKSWTNFGKHPERVCYVPENWDFEENGPGITGQEIIDECGGDKLKARMVFELCDWQYPSTVLGEWDHDDDVALARLREQQDQSASQSFNAIVKDAENRASNRPEGKPPTGPSR